MTVQIRLGRGVFQAVKGKSAYYLNVIAPDEPEAGLFIPSVVEDNRVTTAPGTLTIRPRLGPVTTVATGRISLDDNTSELILGHADAEIDPAIVLFRGHLVDLIWKTTE